MRHLTQESDDIHSKRFVAIHSHLNSITTKLVNRLRKSGAPFTSRNICGVATFRRRTFIAQTNGRKTVRPKHYNVAAHYRQRENESCRARKPDLGINVSGREPRKQSSVLRLRDAQPSDPRSTHNISVSWLARPTTNQMHRRVIHPYVWPFISLEKSWQQIAARNCLCDGIPATNWQQRQRNFF